MTALAARQDVLGRAVVLLEHDRPRVRVVAFELDDVADRGAAERVDRLVGVADDDQLRRRDVGCGRADELAVGGAHLTGVVRAADQLADQHVLGVVGVLVLVDQHVPEAAPVVLGDGRVALQQRRRSA